MTKALISIDYSYDFVADDGKLTAGKPAQAIEDRIAQVTQEAYDNGDYIFVAMDRHDEGDTFHPETKLFRLTILQGQLGENFMVSWLVYMMPSRMIIVSFGWTNVTIQLFQEQIWIFVCVSVV